MALKICAVLFQSVSTTDVGDSALSVARSSTNPRSAEGGSKLKDSQVIPVRCETILGCQHQSKISGSNLGRNTFFNLEQHSEPGQIKIS